MMRKSLQTLRRAAERQIFEADVLADGMSVNTTISKPPNVAISNETSPLNFARLKRALSKLPTTANTEARNFYDLGFR
jgi:hypothetical protein